MKETELVKVQLAEVQLATNPRSANTIRQEDVEEMAQSILEHGILQPPLARRRADGAVEIYCGQRRYYGSVRAEQMATERGLTERAEQLQQLPVLLTQLDDRTMLLHQWVENLQRKDVTPRDEAAGYAFLQKEHGLTLEQIGEKIGKPKQYVSLRLKLVHVTDELWELWEEGKLSVSTLELVGRVPGKEDRAKLAKVVSQPGQYTGRHYNYEEVKQMIARDYMVSLRGVSWELDDIALVPEELAEDGTRICGGACVSCPHNSNNVTELKEGAVTNGKATLCLMPQCWRDKQAAIWKELKDEAKAKGGKVLTDEEAKAIFEQYGSSLTPESGMVSLDEKPDYYATGAYGEIDGVPQKTWHEQLGKKAARALATLARHPKTKQPVWVALREDVIRAVEERLKSKAELDEVKDWKSPYAQRPKPKPVVSTADKAKKDDTEKKLLARQNQLRDMVTKAQWQALADAMQAKGSSEPLLKLACRQAFIVAYETDYELVLSLLGVDPQSAMNQAGDWRVAMERMLVGQDPSNPTEVWLRYTLLFLHVTEVSYQTTGLPSEVESVATAMALLRIQPDKIAEKCKETLMAAEKEAAREEAAAKKAAKPRSDGHETGATQSGASTDETVFEDTEEELPEPELKPTKPKAKKGNKATRKKAE